MNASIKLEHVQQFDIEVDISERTHLYDYGTCKKVVREEKKWDHHQWHGLGGTNHDGAMDNNSMIQVIALVNI